MPPKKVQKNVLPNIHYKRNRIQQIKGFITVVEDKTISKASQTLKTSTASIVNQIQSLEEMLGIKLFKKEGRNIIPTQQGERFYKMAVPIYKGVSNLYEEFTEIEKHQNKGVIEIHAHISVLTLFIPKVLGFLGNNIQYEKLKLTNSQKKDAIQNVIVQECDFAIYPIEKHEDFGDDINIIPLIKYEPVVLFGRNSLLEKKKDNQITFEDIGSAGQYLHVGKYAISDIQRNRINEGILKSNIEIENCTWDTLKEFVKNNLGTTIMHAGYLTEQDKKELQYRKIDNLSPNIWYCAVVRKSVYVKPEITLICDTIKTLFKGNYEE
jgi:DNA-binding transcriptional LysR family regulator